MSRHSETNDDVRVHWVNEGMLVPPEKLAEAWGQSSSAVEEAGERNALFDCRSENFGSTPPFSRASRRTTCTASIARSKATTKFLSSSFGTAGTEDLEGKT